MSVITALTAQNTVTVAAIYPVSPNFIAAQIDAVMEDIGVDAVKIGMLHTPEVIRVVAERLQHYEAPNIVLDPVMVAKSGDKLLQDDAIEALRSVLIPIATVITPNIPEASVLLGEPIENPDQMADAARKLAATGPRAVLLKGGHLKSKKSLDVLYLREDNRIRYLEAERVSTRNTHGTGCTLSSAIASFLAKGKVLEEAICKAKTYITKALNAGANYRLGNGHGPVHHFYSFWE